MTRKGKPAKAVAKDWRLTYGPRPPPGVLTRDVGERVVRRGAGERDVSEQGDWLVVADDERSRGEWVNGKVFYTRPCVKNVYDIGVHAATARLRASRNMRILAKHFPAVQRWAIDCLLCDRAGRDIPRLADYYGAEEAR